MRLFLAVSLLLLTAACSTGGGRFSSPYASGYVTSDPQQCVPFARKVSGVEIYGDAHTWWNKAEPKYGRGIKPRNGAVLVLAQSQRMRHGHLAVVKKVVSDRYIDVTHSNWGNDRKTRSVVYDKHRVEDLSAANDWSSVRFWNKGIDAFGQPYAAHGFIYP